MKKWVRSRYQPNLPLGGRKEKVTASPEHLELARQAGCEGMVLLKNNRNVLPLKSEANIALFGKGVFDYVKGGGGSGDVTVSRVWNLYDGLTERGMKDRICGSLAAFYKEEVERQYSCKVAPGLVV